MDCFLDQMIILSPVHLNFRWNFKKLELLIVGKGKDTYEHDSTKTTKAKVNAGESYPSFLKKLYGYMVQHCLCLG